MKILVTGSCGFIGFHVAKKLLDEGNQVVGTDNFNDYYDPKLKEYREEILKENDNYIPYNTDIENKSGLEKIFEENEIEGVINLAARAGVRKSLEDPYVYLSTNVNGTLNLLEIMKDRGIKKFVLASSSSLYAGQKPPFTEDMAVNKPISPYAATKKSAEMLCYTYHHLYDIDVTVLRYFTVFGPAGRPDMSYFRFISSIMEGKPITIYGDGKQKRDFTYIEDIASGTLKALNNTGFDIINLGGGNEPVSIIYMIRIIEFLIDRKAKINFEDFHNADMKLTSASIEKAKKILDWQPEYDFEEGIKKTVEWFKKNKSLMNKIKI